MLIASKGKATSISFFLNAIGLYRRRSHEANAL